MKRLKIAILFVLTIILTSCLAACSEKKEAADKRSKENGAIRKSFVIALLPKRNVFEQKKRYKPLEEYLSGLLHMDVRTKLLDSYDAVYEEMLNNKVDAAIFGSLSYLVTDSRIPLVPVARPLLEDGTSTYSGLIIVHKDSGITGDVRTWRGKRIALVNKSTTSGYVYPRWYLSSQGIADFEGHFSKVIYAGSHDAAIISLIENEADIAGASNDVFDDLVKRNQIMREKLKVIAASPGVPLNVIGMKQDADSELTARLKKALLDMAQTAEGRAALSSFGASGFIETKKADFGRLIVMLDDLGIRLEEFALDSIARNKGPAAPGKSAEK
ncbi:MAG: phosphate/phosphite/phosphonate ABC transporter substrate-binding protein [Nitrospirae bacterium]|nr:phosphate/phosphite/phosphonate ABC transporter substrate-binding protein [Nitrospirota bacterium]